MEKNLIKVIIFDLDETLYPEISFVESGFKSVSEYVEEHFKINKKEFFETLINVLEREGRGYVFDAALKKYNLYSKKLVNKLVDIYRRHKPNIKTYLGVINLLNSLKKKYKLALITDGLGYVQRNKIKALNIKSFFNLIIFTDDYGEKKSKPNLYAFKKVVKHFNILPKEAIYIGDDPYKDFIGPKKLGIRTIRVLQGKYKDVRNKNEFEADYNISKLTEIRNLLKRY